MPQAGDRPLARQPSIVFLFRLAPGHRCEALRSTYRFPRREELRGVGDGRALKGEMRKLGQAVCVLAAIGVSSAQDAPHPDPERIFAEARRVWDTQVYPTRIDYVVTVRVVQNGVEGVRHYAAEYAPTTNDLHVVATSIEQLAHPEDPHGITIRITREARGQKAFSIPVNPEASLDYL